MEISLLNTRITIQKSTVTGDTVGNHTAVWTDFYSCHATVSGENGSSKGGEDTEAGTVNDHSGISFTVRFCGCLDALTTDGYRVLFHGDIYDIIGIDHMNFKRKCLKLRCRKVRRS